MAVRRELGPGFRWLRLNRFFSLGRSEISAVEFRINDIYAAGEIAERIREAAGDGFVTNTWIELNRPLFSALELEKLALFIAISLIVLVASLNIVSTLTLMVMEKGRDIAIITAMGGDFPHRDGDFYSSGIDHRGGGNSAGRASRLPGSLVLRYLSGVPPGARGLLDSLRFLSSWGSLTWFWFLASPC